MRTRMRAPCVHGGTRDVHTCLLLRALGRTLVLWAHGSYMLRCVCCVEAFGVINVVGACCIDGSIGATHLLNAGWLFLLVLVVCVGHQRPTPSPEPRTNVAVVCTTLVYNTGVFLVLLCTYDAGCVAPWGALLCTCQKHAKKDLFGCCVSIDSHCCPV